MSSLYKLILLFILSIPFVYCSKGELNAPPPTTTSSSSTTSSSTTTTMSYGACERGTCEEPFCAENCESPGKCHVKDIDGICYPSCGYLAVLDDNGYGHYGPDKLGGTEDDTHFLTGPGISCGDIDKWGATDWEKIPPFNGREAHEVVKRGGECCGSDQQVNK